MQASRVLSFNPARINCHLRELFIGLTMLMLPGRSDLFHHHHQVPQKNSRQYPAIKQVGDVALGVATQNLVIGKLREWAQSRQHVIKDSALFVVFTAKIRTAKQQYYSNVALKVNVKLNGVNQVIKNSLAPGFEKTPTIIFGAE